MSYTFFDITTKRECSFDLKNCTITGNSSAFVTKDGKITKYKLIDGEIDKNSGEEVSRIELTNYQISFLNLLKGKDGNSNCLDKADLKDISPESIQKEINDIYHKKGVYEAVSANIDNHSAEIGIKDKTDVEKHVGIKFEKVGFFKGIWNGICNFFKGIFASKDEPEKNDKEKPVKPEYKAVDLKNVFKQDGVEIEPAYEYIAKGGEKPNVLANELGISLYKLKAANPKSNLDWVMEEGQKIVIPERVIVKENKTKNVSDIAKNIGVSENYIKDILFGIEGRHTKPDLTPYYDGVATATNSKGVLTIGFGHTGRVHGIEMNSKNMDEIKITEAEAYQILAQDILNAKLDAIQYFGEDFVKAPQSIQDAIIDVIFNKGIERGIEGIVRDENGKIKSERLETPTRKLKEDLRNEDYAAAAEHVIYKTPLKGLKKRNVYRAIGSLKDLTESEQNEALKRLEKYVLATTALYDGHERDTLSNAWKNAKMGVYQNFFN